MSNSLRPAVRRPALPLARRFAALAARLAVGVVALAATSAAASDHAAPAWNDLSVINENREPPRSFAFPFDDRASALSGARPGGHAESPNVLMLNGNWDFSFAETPDDVPEGFERPDYEPGLGESWSLIPVPANLEIEGYGYANYSNIPYHFTPAEPPVVPADQNWVGCYRRGFRVPNAWYGRRTFLRFEGFASAIEVYVNGERVGYAQGGRAGAEFDITDAMRAGLNVLAVKTYRLSDGSYLEDQDFWRLSGLFRDVLLWSAPPVHIVDYGVRTDLHGDGSATLSVEFEGRQYAAHPAADGGNKPDVHLELVDSAGTTVAERTIKRVPFTLGERTVFHTAMDVRRVLPWTAETPNLYTLLVSLKSGGETLEVIPQRVGFREIDVRDGRVLMNGNPVLMRGVNRHEHVSDRAHAIDMESMLEDIRIMKRHNFNAVRTAHYPNHPVWYQLCDEHGLYVVNEANVESHGIGYKPDATLANKPEWTESHVDRFRRMVVRDRNRPSVTFWSVGNEMGDGVAIAASYLWGKRYDPTRPVQSERAEHVAGNTDLVVPMYWQVERVRRYAETDENPKPLILCEYSHAMGNSNGNFDWYWDLFRKHDVLGGGFIWDWADQGLDAETPADAVTLNGEPVRTQPFFAYGGTFEPEGVHHDDNFCMNGVVNSDRRPKPAMVAIKQAMRPVVVEPVSLETGLVLLTNWYDHLVLDEAVEGSWSLLADGVAVATGSLDVPPLDPRSSAAVKLDLPGDVDAPAGTEVVLSLSFTTLEATEMVPEGHEVAWAQFLMPDQPDVAALPESGDRLVVARSQGEVRVTGRSIEAVVDAETGLLVSISAGGNQPIRSPFVPHFWRAPVDNDRGNGMPRRQGAWEGAGATWSCDSVETSEGPGGSVVVTATGSIEAVEAAYTVTYTVRASGEVHVSAVMDEPKRKGVRELPRFGLRAGVDRRHDRVTWYGPGPVGTTWDRDEAPLGRWASTVAEQYFPYSEPQSTGTHVSTRWLALHDAAGRGLAVFADPEGCSIPVQAITFSALPYSTEQLDEAKYAWQLDDAGFTWLTLDTAMMGVGGDNSWGAREKGAFRLRPTEHRVAFVLRPIASASDIEARRGLAVR